MSIDYSPESFNQLLAAAKLARNTLAILGLDCEGYREQLLNARDEDAVSIFCIGEYVCRHAREWPALDALSAAIIRAEGTTPTQLNQADALEVKP